jgi:tripartite-type tricarboxylate transporter receptor subunit TctC/DNA-binding IscR family transcriptional regulator
MSKSTKLVTATYILSYIAACGPEVVTTDRIADEIDDHPTRVRQLVSSLVKHGLLVAHRGGRGGVQLARGADQITLRDVQEAVQDQSLLSFYVPDPISKWAGKCNVHTLFEDLHSELNAHIRRYLEHHRLDQTYTPLIVPFAPGGTSDVLARMLSDALNPGRKRPILIEYRPAGPVNPLGEIGTHAQLSGQALVIATNSGIVSAALAPGGAERLAQFVPVAQLTTTEMILAVRSDAKTDSLESLIAAARKKPGTVQYASVGPGSMSHLGTEWLQRAAGVRFKHHAFAGAAPAVAGLLAGKVAFYFGTPPTILPYLHSGRLAALATTGRRRSTLLTNTPTLAESFEGLEFTGWQGVFAPSTTPQAEIKRMREQIAKALKQPQARAQLRRQGFTVSEATPAEFEKTVAQEIATWRARIEEFRIKL